MRARSLRRSLCTVVLLLTAACGLNAPSTLSNPGRYVRIGILPAYEAELTKSTPPSWFTGVTVERIDLDFGLNALMVDRVAKALGPTRQLVDLRAFSAAYIGTAKVHAVGERKIIGDSRPVFTDVLRSLVGSQGLDAYVVIEGGAGIYEPQVAPAFQMLASQGHNVGIEARIYVVDGRTFEVAAVTSASGMQRGVPDSWFAAPRQHAEEIKNVVVTLLDQNLGPALQKLGLM
jgi:hypothetical protein